MCTGGRAGTELEQATEAGSGMEMEEDGAEDEGGCRAGMDADEGAGGGGGGGGGGGPVGGRTVLKG